MDWDKLRIFHAVADAGSLTHAGDSLRLSQSAVSRQIRGLEEQLGVTLFHRHARGLILTEQGELLFNATSEMASKLDMAEARIRDSEEHVMGELKVTAATGFGTLWLVPRLNKLYAMYPDLKINLILEERVLDLPMREADVAIRMKEPSQSDLIRRRLLNIRMRLYATRSYLAEAGRPTSMPDLARHRLICQDPAVPQVSAGKLLVQQLLEQSPRSLLMVNNYFGVLQAVLNDVGIGVLPDYLTADFSELVRVFDDVESAEVPVFLAFPEELRGSRRVIAFRDFVVDEIQAYRKAQSSAD
ncbi:MAG TPA: LysR family transcriptional regulator [Paracoccus sp. (in: a-proteobacteria)]|uniref:LysR family transcriptional regulator n=1 Tax=uncultured Paracoccus sp. TaxID=189685 RepID=UPI00262AFF9B|nr:LysR family transcriptional regulator [uncultured Paracoccus sp.]HMQ40719.1 LysR family transcriptional regulator [Paracoccus sp. (in: a-proteobacteria)]HMR37788.1 LysR family transcriptional regulator [Paracoccus sp. (in: a-proteobacteria)]